MDIDIDLPSTFNPKDVFPECVLASRVHQGKLVKHPCGAYFQNMPVDTITGLAAIPHEQAEALGFTKIDFLHLSLLDVFTSKQEIRTLIAVEPDWNLLLDASCVEKLFQLKNSAELLQRTKPRSIIELADCIALIRPGKVYLQDRYVSAVDRARIRKELYAPSDRPYYKKSHAVSYAHAIVLQMHLVKAGIL